MPGYSLDTLAPVGLLASAYRDRPPPRNHVGHPRLYPARVTGAVISYAQNAEDVVLARLFSTNTGRYVDIGAGDPLEASVTKHFSDAGWHGINIEPVPSVAETLRTDRPRDHTLALAIGARSGTETLYVVEHEPGWSTLDGELARHYREELDWRVTPIEVQTRTLTEVLDDYPGPIDFLKIDAEGAERDIIEGADWTRHEPRVVLVEATVPGSETPAHDDWEHLLTAVGYRCALFDGLNRFYAAADDDEALQTLAVPANVFDAFETLAWRKELDERTALQGYVRRLEDSLREAHEARTTDAEYLHKLESTIGELKRERSRKDRYIDAVHARINELESSTTAGAPLAVSTAAAATSTHHQTTTRVNRAAHTGRGETPEQLVERLNKQGDSHHRLVLPDGHVIHGIYDMGKYLPHFRLPQRLDESSVLDVGTASGYFAIECHRRGANVTAIDVENDRILPQIIRLFGLDITYSIRDLYDLDSSFGQFDLVICGTLLLHLPDPLGALRTLRTLVNDRLILSTTAIPNTTTSSTPVCHFFGEHASDGDYWSYWGFSAAALERMLLAAGFSRITNIDYFDLEPEPGHPGAFAPQVVLSAYV